MRRKDKEITDIEEMREIIRRSIVCRVAMCDGDTPYVVPMCHGLHENTLYFHCAPVGRKLDIIRKNPKVCFEFDLDNEVIPSEKSCDIHMKYRCVIGYGVASVVEDESEFLLGLNAVSRQYGGPGDDFDPARVQRIAMLKIDITEMTGKKAGY